MKTEVITIGKNVQVRVNRDNVSYIKALLKNNKKVVKNEKQNENINI